MEKETFKQELKSLAVKLGIIDKPEVVSSKFEEVVLSDESVVMIEPTIEVGASVMIAVDGESQPVPDGSYELSDKRVITVEGGVISNVEELPEVEEEMQAEEVVTQADVKAMLDALGIEFSKQLKAVKDEFKAYKVANETKSLENNKVILEAFKTFGETPSETVPKKKSGWNVKKPNGLANLIEQKYKK